MARERGSGRVSLVVTAALRHELPVDWLLCRDVRVHSLRALQSGALHRRRGRNGGVLFVVTGVGPAASRAAALWIKERVAPLFVVNVGTAGVLDPGYHLGELISPSVLQNEEGAQLAADTRLPFPWPRTLARTTGGVLLTVAAPLLGRPGTAASGCHFVDMEAFAQAQVFHGTGIAFHVLKGLSDRPGTPVRQQFEAAPRALRDKLTQVFAFLEGPGDARISAVIPVHNRADRIAPCVQSVLAQELAPAEVIVVDDGSTDGTAESLASCGDRIRLIRLPENRGVSAARNRGIAEARCSWVAFLDSDDLWRTDKLGKEWRFLEEHPHFEAVQCGEIWIRRGVRVNPRRYHEKAEGWIWSQCLERCLVTPSALLARRTLLEDLGGFDESLPACEDYDLWIRLARHHVVGLEPSLSVVKHGGHDDQLSRRYCAMDRFRVQALLKALEQEESLEFRVELRRTLRRKLVILLDGSRKRGLSEQVRKYEELLQSLGSVAHQVSHRRRGSGPCGAELPQR